MSTPTPADVHRALQAFDARHQKIVAGMLTVMIRNPERVREREWIAQQLTEIVLLAGEFEGDSTDQVVGAVQEFLHAHVHELLNASFLLFHRVALDLEPRAETGFTFDEAVARGLEYLPSLEPAPEAPSSTTDARDRSPRPLERELGEQPLARLMAARGLKPSDLVAASTEQLTHKMVARAMKGRRLTANTMGKIRRAWRRAAADDDGANELFDYAP